MNNLAIIPARGGSKRIPRKNIKDFLGKPIIAYSIEIALKSGLFGEVMVSTDDKEIAMIAEKFGARVPFYRSDQTANDYATLADVIDEVKVQYLYLGHSFENMCCILPTAPLITLENLRKGLEMLHFNKDADSVWPIVRFSYPIQRSLKLQNGRIEMYHPEYYNTRSQDLEPAFHDAGQFYWMKFHSNLCDQNRLGLEIKEIECQDIDSIEDWNIAELKYKALTGFLK